MEYLRTKNDLEIRRRFMADFSINISVIKDCDNKNIVVINDIIFKGKQIN